MAEPLRRSGLEGFDETALRHVDAGGVPGVVALVASGDQVHVATAGTLSLGGAPVKRDTLFRIASVTKPVTGAATLALATEGLLSLDEPIDRHVPELADRRVLRRPDAELDDTVPAERAITVRDLLTFTFGFGASGEMFTAERPWPVVMAERALDLHTLGPPDPVHQPETDAWIAGLGSLPLMAQPGESWLYNTGASVLGVLIQRVTGVPLSEVFASRLFQPLGMHDTTMWTSDVGRLATAYVATANGFEMWDAPDGGWSRPPRFEDGAAGLVSTVDDLLAIARMLLAGGDGIVAPELVAAMTTNQLRSSQGGAGAAPILLGRGWGFCQSVLTEGPRAGAFGWNGGLGTTWLVDPVRSLTVIVMTQRLFSSPDPPQVHVDLQAAAYAALDL
jgi:CubicO group peptidase (beta-lactamase class C family)